MAMHAIAVPTTPARPRRESISPPSAPVAAALRGRVVLPLIGFVVLVAAVAVPATLAGRHERAAPAERPPTEHVLASEIGALDAVPGFPETAWPRSGAPVGGMAFVRCTNLWISLPDGSEQHRLLNMPGLASPAFSPDGRTIAFLAEREGEQEIWMAAADGSKTDVVGSVASGGSPPDRKSVV